MVPVEAMAASTLPFAVEDWSADAARAQAVLLIVHRIAQLADAI